ncbi:MAG: RbsD/FucU domain-containing protein [Kiloniellales bacterium]|nr:RbsD/FucU domain-containing protein [Kiloniellales bacterium]MDJ0983011.1 RbsD/FucU domain-containing protein [Kiloniellales bacterium]
MLKGVPPIVGAELLWVLESMGHGDDLVLVDRNFPADSVARHSATGKLIRLDGVDCTQAARAILALYPLDSFVETPIQRMEVVGEPETLLEVHQEVLAVAREAEGSDVAMGSIERHAFYAEARKGYAVVQTTEARPYGCFLLKKGVIFD